MLIHYVINNSQLIRMPSMLLRRLKSGKLAPISICPLLAEPQKIAKIVLIPDQHEDSNSVGSLIAQNLLQHHFQLAVFQDDPKDFARQYPELVQSEENENEMNTRRVAQFPAKVMPYVFLGNVETARDHELLKKHGISHIINVTNDLPNYFESDPDFHYLRIPVDDNCANNLSQFFPDAISFIEKARSENSAVLVHCLAGISRSVTVCLAYLMYARQSTLDEAFDQLHRQNHLISPNFNFMKSLLNWERHISKHHQRASSHPQQQRIQHQYDEDSGQKWVVVHAFILYFF
ncbi:Protein-tyrosine-phosphatase [Aphelenchoides bicaudatus]|nr:Protein-tyrosine-phosphatase [Aphelenchoides bicaudatus]